MPPNSSCSKEQEYLGEEHEGERRRKGGGSVMGKRCGAEGEEAGVIAIAIADGGCGCRRQGGTRDAALALAYAVRRGRRGRGGGPIRRNRVGIHNMMGSRYGRGRGGGGRMIGELILRWRGWSWSWSWRRHSEKAAVIGMDIRWTGRGARSRSRNRSSSR